MCFLDLTTELKRILAEDMCIDISGITNKVTSTENEPYCDLLIKTINKLCSLKENESADKGNYFQIHINFLVDYTGWNIQKK